VIYEHSGRQSWLFDFSSFSFLSFFSFSSIFSTFPSFPPLSSLFSFQSCSPPSCLSFPSSRSSPSSHGTYLFLIPSASPLDIEILHSSRMLRCPLKQTRNFTRSGRVRAVLRAVLADCVRMCGGNAYAVRFGSSHVEMIDARVFVLCYDRPGFVLCYARTLGRHDAIRIYFIIQR